MIFSREERKRKREERREKRGEAQDSPFFSSLLSCLFSPLRFQTLW
jgi:hypothetical protein